MSKSSSTVISNKTNTYIPFQNRIVKNKKTIYDKAIEECLKLYSKNCTKPNQYVLNQFKKEKLNIYLNYLKTKDLTIIGKLLTKYFYFKHIELSPFDPEKEDCSRKKKNRLKEISSNQKGFNKIAKPKNPIEKEKIQNISKIIMSISRNLCFSDNIISLSINSITITKDSARYLAQGLYDNKTIQGLNINFSIISLESYEILLKSILKHEMLKYLDLSNNNFSDKYGEMIALIISSQSQRRDQILWASGLRNGTPQINEYSKGLVSINLRGNKLGNYSADCLAKSLSQDQYIRIIDLSENNLDNNSCKKFIHMMRKNNILLTVDLRENPGYDEAIYQRMIMKMSKNIRYLYQQFQNGEYTEEEFENLKEFIDISFFDVDIPQEIVDYYNGNIQDTLEDNGEELNDQMQIDNMNVMNDIQERAEEEEDEDTVKTVQEKEDNKSNQNISVNDNNNVNKNTEEENKKLIEENIQLKEKIKELKSRGDNGGKTLIKPYDPNNIEENYSYIINLINELNEVMNNIEKIKNKTQENTNNNNKIENIQNNEEIYIQNEENNNEENIKIKNNEENINNIQSMPKQEENDENNNSEQEINLDNLDEKEDDNLPQQFQVQKQEIKSDEKNNEIINEDNMVQNDEEIQNENNEINGEGEEEVAEEGENDDEEINLDDLTEEEKIALLQQREILEKLKEEAEAKGEHFDVQEYLEMLEKQANEEEEEGDIKNEDDKNNKSF